MHTNRISLIEADWVENNFSFCKEQIQVYLQNFKPGTIKTKLFNYFARTWCVCVYMYIGEKSHFMFHLPLLCLILAVSVLRGSLILIIFLLSCKPQGMISNRPTHTHTRWEQQCNERSSKKFTSEITIIESHLQSLQFPWNCD